MLTGETVVLERPTEISRNAHGQPRYEWVPETVENVLVAPGPRNDIALDIEHSARPEGVIVLYSLYWPKTFTGNLAGTRVRLKDEDEPLMIIGDPKPYPDANTPTEWNRPSEVRRADG